jgi:hypothetical protein
VELALAVLVQVLALVVLELELPDNFQPLTETLIKFFGGKRTP